MLMVSHAFYCSKNCFDCSDDTSVRSLQGLLVRYACNMSQSSNQGVNRAWRLAILYYNEPRGRGRACDTKGYH